MVHEAIEFKCPRAGLMPMDVIILMLCRANDMRSDVIANISGVRFVVSCGMTAKQAMDMYQLEAFYSMGAITLDEYVKRKKNYGR